MKLARYKQGVSLLFRMFSPYRWRIALVALLTFISGVLGGLGVNAVIPLFSFLGAGEAPTDGVSLAIVGFFASVGLPHTARFLLVFIVLLFFARAIFLFISQMAIAKTVADFEERIRHTILEITFQCNWSFLSRQKLGHLDQMLTSDITGSSAILNYLGSMLFAAVNTVVYSILIWNISPPVVFVAFIYSGCLFLIFAPLLRFAKRFSRVFVDKQKELAHYGSEHLLGAKLVKAYDVEKSVLARGRGLLSDLRSIYLKLVTLQNATSGLFQFLGVLCIVLLFVFLYKTAAFEFASFAVMVYSLHKVFWSIQSAQMNLHIIMGQAAHAEAISRHIALARGEREAQGAGVPFEFKDALMFKEVSFAYSDARPALSRVSFSVQRGSMLGIIGPSGSGKTTIVDLLLLLISPSEGHITLDGKNSSTIDTASWRARVAYVPQDVFLLNDTIENNIRFYGSATKDQVVEAARQANILAFIKKQPQGLQTVVGERGSRLSGGERQRIALARALVRNPEVLILDEATSALDAESEELIRRAIAKLHGTITVIVIAHRLSTIEGADMLVALRQGKVVEMGRPVELLQDANSYYFRARRAA